jgi:NADPH2:quinone reductase
MKAVILRRTGGPEVLERVDAPDPGPKRGEIVVKAEAMGVGWPDILIRKGAYKWSPPLPASPGSELCGVVEALGEGTSQFAKGQRVLVSARDLPTRGGCYVERIAVPESIVYQLAENVNPEQAVALPNFQVAYAILQEAARGPRPAKSVFVTGGAGGVGSAILQLARHAGMRALTSVSSESKARFAKEQGATDTINYRRENVAQRVRELTAGEGVDVVLDHVAGPDFTENLGMLKPWGTLVSFNSYAGSPTKDLFAELRAQVDRCIGMRVFSMHVFDDDAPARRAIMQAVIALLEKGAINPAIAARYPLAQAAAAQIAVEEGNALGKVVLVP